MTTGARTEGIPVSVYGPRGVIDLMVPEGAAATDVAREYARQVNLAAIPFLCTSIGQPLPADVPLRRAGVAGGDLLVAMTGVHRGRSPGLTQQGGVGEPRTPVAPLVFAIAGLLAVLAGWFAATSADGSLRWLTVVALAVGAVLSLVPAGTRASERSLAGPAFATGAALALVWDPMPARLPMVLGVALLAGAVTSAVARALDPSPHEGHRVWIAAGLFCFVSAALVLLAGWPERVTWSLWAIGAVLASRFVPSYAVDVPDHYLLDLDRLAVSAWSARERPRGRRTRVVVPESAMAVVAARGAQLVTSAAAAVLAVTALAAPLVLHGTTLHEDHLGAEALVFFDGASLLLVARSYRHAGARALLRAAGLVSWAALVWDRFRAGEVGVVVALVALALAAIVLVVAVATGRGWRSAWWARRAEIGESLCGALAVASIVVASGLFRTIWEMTSH